MSNLQSTPFLREQRNFPTDDAQSLQVEVDKAYIDIAQKVNSRTIGIYALNNQVVNGNIWYLRGASLKQQALQQVFTFTSTASINHGLNLSQIDQFVNMYGTFTDGTKWYGLIAGNIGTPIAGQIVFDITPTQIEFASGAGAPTLTRGSIVLEWLAFP